MPPAAAVKVPEVEGFELLKISIFNQLSRIVGTHQLGMFFEKPIQSFFAFPILLANEIVQSHLCRLVSAELGLNKGLSKLDNPGKKKTKTYAKDRDSARCTRELPIYWAC